MTKQSWVTVSDEIGPRSSDDERKHSSWVTISTFGSYSRQSQRGRGSEGGQMNKTDIELILGYAVITIISVFLFVKFNLWLLR